MNVGYLSKLFARETGIKFSDYLNKKRLETAKQLMSVYPDSSVKEIADEVGFGGNPRYFSQVFRKYEGVVPSDFLKANTNNE